MVFQHLFYVFVFIEDDASDFSKGEHAIDAQILERTW